MKIRGIHVALGLLVSVAVFHLSNLMTVFCYRLSWYDEGCYFQQALEWSVGRVPYTDFFIAHPPGVCLLVRLANSVGLSFFGLRLVYWLSGVLLTYLIANFTRNVCRANGIPNPWLLGGLAAVFYSASDIALDAESLIMTDLPAAFMILGAVYCLFTNKLGGIFLAALLLVLSTTFRIQGLVAAPGMAFWVWISHGKVKGFKYAVLFTALVLFGLILVHYGLSLVYENYFDCVLGFQAKRFRMTWTNRIISYKQLLIQPQFSLGMFAACTMLATKNRNYQGFALTILIATFASMTVGKSMAHKDFLFIIALLSICCSILLGTSEWFAKPEVFLAVAMFIVGSQAPLHLSRWIRPLKLNQWESKLLQEVREFPGETIYTSDYKISYLTGKSLPVDYYMVDHFPLTHGNVVTFDSWFPPILDKTDAIVVTDHLLDMTPRTWEFISESKKPLIFANDEVQDRYKALTTRGPGAKGLENPIEDATRRPMD